MAQDVVSATRQMDSMGDSDGNSDRSDFGRYHIYASRSGESRSIGKIQS